MSDRQPARRGGWDRFPFWFILCMGTVMAVNARFIAIAYQSFPGAATSDDFDTSNNYNQVLEAAQKQALLGWQVGTDVAHPFPAIMLADRTGQPLTGVAVEAIARHPVGDAPDQALSIFEASPGRYQWRETLAPGQWDLLLRLTRGGQKMRIERRILVEG